MKILITCLLICSMMTAGAGAGEKFKLLSKPDHDPEPEFLTIGVCAGIGVFIAGTVIVIVTLHYCDKWFGTNQPPANTTNTFNIERSDNLAGWNHVGSVTNTFENFVWRETNHISESQHFYRLNYDPVP